MWFIVVGMKKKGIYRKKGGLDESTRTPHGTLNIVPNRPSTIHNVNLLM